MPGCWGRTLVSLALFAGLRRPVIGFSRVHQNHRGAFSGSSLNTCLHQPACLCCACWFALLSQRNGIEHLLRGFSETREEGEEAKATPNDNKRVIYIINLMLGANWLVNCCKQVGKGCAASPSCWLALFFFFAFRQLCLKTARINFTISRRDCHFKALRICSVSAYQSQNNNLVKSTSFQLTLIAHLWWDDIF